MEEGDEGAWAKVGDEGEEAKTGESGEEVGDTSGDLSSKLLILWCTEKNQMKSEI